MIRTAAVNRTHFDARAAIQVDDIGQAQEALEALAQGRAHPAVSTGTARLLGGVVFVFPGQGSQWPGMGRALLAESAVFADAIAACDAALLPHTGWSVRAVLGGDDGEEVPPLDRVDVVQPVLFAMAIGLAAVWRSLGVRPDAVIGHSQGEIAAAVVAGALSLEDGARIAAVRSKLVRRLAGGGGMAVVELPVDAVEGLLERDGLALSIAVVNTATSTVVSGDREAIEQFVGRRTEEGVFCRRVDVDYASHSAQVDGILGELKEALHGVQPRAASVGMFSTVTGDPLEGTELDAQYWCRNLRQPVRLDRGLAAVLGQGHGVFIEVSAHPVLAMPLTTACAGVQGVVVGSLRRDAGGLATLHRNLGVLHTQGYAVSWATLARGRRRSGGGAAHLCLPAPALLARGAQADRLARYGSHRGPRAGPLNRGSKRPPRGARRAPATSRHCIRNRSGRVLWLEMAQARRVRRTPQRRGIMARSYRRNAAQRGGHCDAP